MHRKGGGRRGRGESLDRFHHHSVVEVTWGPCKFRRGSLDGYEKISSPRASPGEREGVHPPASLNFPFSSWLAAIFISHYHSSSSAEISKCQYTRGKKLRGRHFPPRQRRRRFFHGQLRVELWGGHDQGVVQRKISSSRSVRAFRGVTVRVSSIMQLLGSPQISSGVGNRLVS